jgi:uncharacterized membrane protein
MREKKINRLLNFLYGIGAIAVLSGAFFRIQHFPYGNYLLLGGAILGVIAAITKLVVSRG